MEYLEGKRDILTSKEFNLVGFTWDRLLWVYIHIFAEFAGKYFKLGADITINTGEVADWATKAPKYSWTSIGTSAKPFKGNFNGKIQKIF